MSDIKIEDITTGKIEGDGVFDKLMLTMDARLQAEYSKGRLKGGDYAKVYLGSMESIISQSMQFVLGEQQADKQADLITAQTLNVSKEGLVLDQEVLLKEAQVRKMDQDVINSVLEGQMLKFQADKIQAEISLMAKQEAKIDADIDIAIQQLTALTSEIALTNAKKLLVDAQKATELLQPAKLIAETALIGKQEDKIDKEIELMQARINTEVAQLALITGQINKITAEILLIEEKRWTEKAQYSDTTGDPNASVAGVIGKQKVLYTAQTDGFARDAEQKATKIAVDTWNVSRSSDPIGVQANSTNKLDDNGIGAFMTKLLAGI